MALPIRDGNQTLTTLSTIIVNSAHVPAHSVVSLGSQAITDIATAVSGVELGPNTISALENIAVTFGVGASVTIGNVVSVTGGLTDSELRASSVTIGGSVQVSNFPATQAVTFTQASVTFTQASVTFGQAVVSASNIGDLLSSVATDNTPDATTKFVKIGGHQSGSNQTSHIVHVSAGGSMSVDASGSSVTFTQASVTFNSITGSVSVLNFPATQTTTFSAITGSVSVLNLPATQTVTFTQASVTFGTPVVTGSVSVLNFPSTQTIAGTVTIGASSVTFNAYVGQRGDGTWSPISLQTGSNYVNTNVWNSVTIASLPAISGTVTANAGGDFAGAIEIVNDVSNVSHKVAVQLYDDNGSAVGVPNNPLTISGTVTVGSLPDGVGFGQQLAEGYDNYGGAPVQIVSSSITQSISGTVTANVPMVSNQPTGQGQAIPVILITDEGKSVFDVNQSLPVSGAFYQATQPVSIASLPASTVTVSSLPSVTISSLPAISGTVTANVQGTITAGMLLVENANNSFPNQNPPVQLSANPQGGSLRVRLDYNAIADAQPNSSSVIGRTDVLESGNNAYIKAKVISGTVTVGNSVTIGSLPAISGTVTANLSQLVSYASTITKSDTQIQIIGGYSGGSPTNAIAYPIGIDSSGNISSNLYWSGVGNSPTQVATSSPLPVQVVSQGSITIGNSTTSSAVFVKICGEISSGGPSEPKEIITDSQGMLYARLAPSSSLTAEPVIYDPVGGGSYINVRQYSGTSTTIGSLPNGALTTRFGSVATANMAFITSAVTNTSRKYLLAQNISAGTVTIGIGFSPTTTQGIQLNAGAGLTFDSFCPTGAVYWLGAVTGAAFTILEG